MNERKASIKDKTPMQDAPRTPRLRRAMMKTVRRIERSGY
jgi:hypothetical protein